MDDDGTAPRFEPIRRIAQSYLGTLWVAADKRGGRKREALLRRVRLPKGAPPELRESITRAATAAQNLKHTNVLSVLEVLEDGAELGIAYEHIDAEPLRALQASAEQRGLSFPIGVSLRIAVDLLMGLESLHQAHASGTTVAPFGGLCPDSVLVSKQGQTKLLDALVASCASSLDAIGCNIEKLGYAAPEQVHPTAPLTAQTDLFAVGALLWELLTGRRLLVGTRAVIERRLLDHDLPSLSHAAREGEGVSQRLATLVDAALAAEPGKRPASARAMAEQLQRCGHQVAAREELGRLVMELSGARSERGAAAQAQQPAPQPASAAAVQAPPAAAQAPQPASASTSAARNIRLPMPARARSRVERPLDAAPPVVAPRATPTLPGLPKASQPSPSVPLGAAAIAPPSEPARSEPVRSEPARPAPTPPEAVRSEPAPPEARSEPALPEARPEPAAPEAVRIARIRPVPVRPVPVRPAPVRAEPSAPEPPAPELMAQEVVTSPEVAVTDPPMSREETVPAAAITPSALGRVPAMEMDAPPPSAATSPAWAEPAEEPVPSSERHAFSLPPAPPEIHAAEMALSSAGVQRGPRTLLRRKVSLGLLAAALGVAGAVAVASALKLPSANADAPAAAALPAVPAALAPLEAERKPSSAHVPSGAVDVDAPLAAAPAVERTDAPPPAVEEVTSAATSPASTTPGEDFQLEELGDRQLVAAFSLEQRRDVPACSERLGADAGGYTGNQPYPSRSHFNAARRALQRGELDLAYTELCIATAHDLDNLDAQRNLAELALDLGDPGRAKEAAEGGLRRAPKNTELLGVLGDALAMLGNIPESRRLWLETLHEQGPEDQRRQRLAARYQKAGERSASSFDFSRARSYFRRALILTEGGYPASLGLADALLWLAQARAGLAWAERAAHALPASARAHILLGDARAKTGELEAAREAWQAARRAEPGNVIAARRLSRGLR